jgi:hypothetical protein
MALPKAGKKPKFPENLHPSILLSTTGKRFEKLILKTIHRHIAERNLLNASLLGFRARLCTRLTDHASLNFNNNMSTSTVRGRYLCIRNRETRASRVEQTSARP